MSSRYSYPRLLLSLTSAAALAGCAASPPPPRVAVPRSPTEGGSVMTYERLRPLPEPQLDEPGLPPPAFDDGPLINQAPPEQPAYLGAYARVGRPRVVVFVNRTLEGRIVNADGSKSGADTAAATGNRDDAQAAPIDYEAIELVLTDLLAADGRVTIVSPTMARQRLSDSEVKDLQSGRPQALREVAEKLDADVLIQAQARPTRQADGENGGPAVRMVVEAFNTRGGESVARAFVDVPPPLDKQTINRYARFLARRTMYELAGAWNAMDLDEHRPTTRP